MGRASNRKWMRRRERVRKATSHAERLRLLAQWGQYARFWMKPRGVRP